MSEADRLAALESVASEIASFNDECGSVLFPDGVPLVEGCTKPTGWAHALALHQTGIKPSKDDEITSADIDARYFRFLEGTLAESDVVDLLAVPSDNDRRPEDPLSAARLLEAVTSLEQCYPGRRLPDPAGQIVGRLRTVFANGPLYRRDVLQAIRLTQPQLGQWLKIEMRRIHGVPNTENIKRQSIAKNEAGAIPAGMPFIVDEGFFGDGSTFPIHSTDFVAIDGDQWLRCPVAHPALLDTEIERLVPRLRELRLISDQQTILWLGYQRTFDSRCECAAKKSFGIECPIKIEPRSHPMQPFAEDPKNVSPIPPVIWKDEANSADEANQAPHSTDFVSVNWFGTAYTFTKNQAACVRVLWEAWENRTPALSAATILTEAEISHDRLSVVFRNNPAWGTMILKVGQGRYQLNPPAHDDTPVAQQ